MTTYMHASLKGCIRVCHVFCCVYQHYSPDSFALCKYTTSFHSCMKLGHLTQANLQRIVDADGSSGRNAKTGVHADEHILVQSVCDTCGRTSGSQTSVMTIDQSPSSCTGQPRQVSVSGHGHSGGLYAGKDDPIWISSDPRATCSIIRGGVTATNKPCRTLDLAAGKDKLREAAEHEAAHSEAMPDPLMDVTLFMARERLKELEMQEELCEVKWEAAPREDMLKNEITSLRRRCAPLCILCAAILPSSCCCSA
jgi:hypothetical protein